MGTCQMSLLHIRFDIYCALNDNNLGICTWFDLATSMIGQPAAFHRSYY